MPKAPAPLFRDPIHDGAADPAIIFNRQENSWWIIYTNRRANVDCRGEAWYHGTDIGVASSSDRGGSWIYRGILDGLRIDRGRNTFWAPEILWHQGKYHLYVSYVRGVPHDWSGERRILHFSSLDLWQWSHQSALELSSNRVIDACVQRMPGGQWRMWYKDEVNHSHTYAADSSDLHSWKVIGPVITDCSHEGPNVFKWRGFYWMVTDTWDGFGVYRSPDAEKWERQENILKVGGNRPDDGVKGNHADVLVSEERAYIIYHTHPGGPASDSSKIAAGVTPYCNRRSSLQIAELRLNNGLLSCDRDTDIELSLGARDNWCSP